MFLPSWDDMLRIPAVLHLDLDQCTTLSARASVEDLLQ